MATKTFKPGSVLSETQFYKVDSIVGNNVILVTDSNEKIQVSKGYAETLLDSADDFTTVEKITRTELVEKFLTSTRVAMTVNFNKKVDEAAIRKDIISLYPNKGGKLISEADFTKKVKQIIDLKGEERVMRGRHYGIQDANGRVSFVDMDLPSTDPTARKRLVDPRTLNWLIVNGVKYEVKK
jgi:hypothetical protein